MSITKRIRDPLHGLITFDLTDQVDRTVWKLINTPEFQRLRRVKQLGVSEFTFPGATHNRFAHSIGVFHVARRLMKVAEKEMLHRGKWSPFKAHKALIAALIHDIGHGPFSHAFEEAEKVRLKGKTHPYQNHEIWTAKIICSQQGAIRRILTEEFDGSFADEIATLLTNDPIDIYGAVVSSSFDADRLDYLQRDKMMSGSGAGGIDFDWLIDNLRVVEVDDNAEDSVNANNEQPSVKFETFCFAEKAVQAAESFVIARYHLYSQVYYHKTTRGMEQLLTAFLAALSLKINSGEAKNRGFSDDHPLTKYYSYEEPKLEYYLKLDDTTVWNAVEICANWSGTEIGDLAVRLRDRVLMKPISIETLNPTATDKARRKFIDEQLGDKINKSIFEDRASLSIYKDMRRETIKSHKRVRILRADGSTSDLASLSKPIEALTQDHEVLRYYFLDENTHKIVSDVKR